MRLFVLLFAAAAAFGADLRVGLIGMDISHAYTFPKMLNDEKFLHHVAGARVVAAYPGTRGVKERYYDRITKEFQIEIVPDIPSLMPKVDAVIITSGDGNLHLGEIKQLLAAKKPVFIDKWLATKFEDAVEIARITNAAGVPVFSASSLRYEKLTADLKFPDVIGADVWAPGGVEGHEYLEASEPAYHAIEMLYSVLGPGCEQVTRVVGANFDDSEDVVAARWKGGRTATVRTLRPSGPFGMVVFRPGGVVQSPAKPSITYVTLMNEVLKFFRSGVSPVAMDEMLEVISFIDASQRSKDAGGNATKLRR